jgi:DNA-directed RNA polymerase subunit RPC12/RpoP
MIKWKCTRCGRKIKNNVFDFNRDAVTGAIICARCKRAEGQRKRDAKRRKGS